jgi:protein-L-isoaspartate O-methyltransferase
MAQALTTAVVAGDQRADFLVDACLPMGAIETISAPFMLALMIQRIASKLTDGVLEQDTGSGFQAVPQCRAVAVPSGAKPSRPGR